MAARNLYAASCVLDRIVVPTLNPTTFGMLDLLVDWYRAYGIMVAMMVIVAAALALPLPASLLLITAGAIAEHSSAALLPLVLGCLAAAVVGDQLAYHLGRTLRRTAGGRLPLRRIDQALHLTQSRGMWGVFLTRWLFAPLGPAVSYAAGMLRFPRARFAIASALGEIVWVVGYVGIGASVGDRLGRVSTIAVSVPVTAAATAVFVLVAASALRLARRGIREVSAATEPATE